MLLYSLFMKFIYQPISLHNAMQIFPLFLKMLYYFFLFKRLIIIFLFELVANIYSTLKTTIRFLFKHLPYHFSIQLIFTQFIQIFSRSFLLFTELFTNCLVHPQRVMFQFDMYYLLNIHKIVFIPFCLFTKYLGSL